ncbi:MAG: protocatechuate 3,4-dioxygenase subunit alpha [Rubrobacteraceae bacterium]
MPDSVSTPSQTVGPFFHLGLLAEDGSRLVDLDHPSAIRIHGTVYDGAGEPVPDAMLELWQANAAGRYAHHEDGLEDLPPEDGFSSFGRCGTDDAGRFEFVTLKPGSVPGTNGQPQAPHINMSVFARGLLKRLVTRIYFPDEEEANAADQVLASIQDPAFRSTLVAHAARDGLRFDVRLQGERQTAFFDV